MSGTDHKKSQIKSEYGCITNACKIIPLRNTTRRLYYMKPMPLPRLPKKEPKSVSVTIRLSPDVASQLKILANDHGLSQADVVEYLISEEYKLYSETKKKPNSKT